MSPLLAPIFAQLITLSLADRTEGRHVSTADDPHFEVETRPAVDLSVAGQRTNFLLRYAPQIVAPNLNSDSHQWLVFHNGTVAFAYRVDQTLIGIYGTVGYGERNFNSDALGDTRPVSAATVNPPNDTTGTGTVGTGTTSAGTGTGTGGTAGTPNTGATGTTGSGSGTTGTTGPGVFPKLPPQIVRFQTYAGGVTVTRTPSKALELRGELGYFVTGGVDHDTREFYPLTVGPRLAGTVTDRVDRLNKLATSVSWQDAIASAVHVTKGNECSITKTVNCDVPIDGSVSWAALVSERLEHTFDPRTIARVGVGGSLTRTSSDNGLIAYGIYPTFDLGIAHGIPLARGLVTLNGTLSSAPALDPVQGTFDPRLTSAASVSWVRERFGSSLFGGSTLSMFGPKDQRSLQLYTGGALVSYRLGAGFSVDGGVRMAWQSYGNQTVLPFSWAQFVGITFGVPVVLSGRR